MGGVPQGSNQRPFHLISLSVSWWRFIKASHHLPVSDHICSSVILIEIRLLNQISVQLRKIQTLFLKRLQNLSRPESSTLLQLHNQTACTPAQVMLKLPLFCNITSHFLHASKDCGLKTHVIAS